MYFIMHFQTCLVQSAWRSNQTSNYVSNNGVDVEHRTHSYLKGRTAGSMLMATASNLEQVVNVYVFRLTQSPNLAWTGNEY